MELFVAQRHFETLFEKVNGHEVQFQQPTVYSENTLYRQLAANICYPFLY